MLYSPKEYKSFGKSFSVMPYRSFISLCLETMDIAVAVSILEIEKSTE